jgi:hypothetical protein
MQLGTWNYMLLLSLSDPAATRRTRRHLQDHLPNPSSRWETKANGKTVFTGAFVLWYGKTEVSLLSKKSHLVTTPMEGHHDNN